MQSATSPTLENEKREESVGLLVLDDAWYPEPVKESEEIDRTDGEEMESRPRIEDDFYTWLLDQASQLRRHRYSSLDWNNLAEELEATALSEERGLESQLERLFGHLLKWAYQPDHRSSSWEASIENARDEIKERLRKSPGLQPKIRELAETAYRRARRTAGGDMGLSRQQREENLPDSLPWTVAIVLDNNFWPDSLA